MRAESFKHPAASKTTGPHAVAVQLSRGHADPSRPENTANPFRQQYVPVMQAKARESGDKAFRAEYGRRTNRDQTKNAIA